VDTVKILPPCQDHEKRIAALEGTLKETLALITEQVSELKKELLPPENELKEPFYHR
jgi:hypothetical protein